MKYTIAQNSLSTNHFHKVSADSGKRIMSLYAFAGCVKNYVNNYANSGGDSDNGNGGSNSTTINMVDKKLSVLTKLAAVPAMCARIIFSLRKWHIQLNAVGLRGFRFMT